MKVPSASKLQIGLACNGSVSLPYVAEDRVSGGVAASGVDLHDVIDTLYSDGREAAEKKAAELGCLADFLLIPSHLFEKFEEHQTESVFEYNLATGASKIHGRNGEFTSPTGIWTRGIADLVGWEGTTMVVIDWKTGYGSPPPAKQNWQLIVTALAFRNKRHCTRIVAKIVKTRTAEVDVCEYEPEFLDSKQEELESFAKTISEESHKTRFRTGEHCRFCPSWVFCPAQTTAIKRASATTDLLESGPITGSDVERAIDNIKAMDDLAVKAKKKIREYIEINGGEFTMSNGVIIVPGKTPGQYRRK